MPRTWLLAQGRAGGSWLALVVNVLSGHSTVFLVSLAIEQERRATSAGLEDLSSGGVYEIPARLPQQAARGCLPLL